MQSKQLDKQVAVMQQGLNFQQQSVELERFIEQNQVAAEAAAKLRNNLQQVNEINLDNIQKQFDPMTEVLNGVQGSFKTFFSDLISGSKSFGEAFKGLIDSIVGNLANMAAEWLSNELFGQLFGGKKQGIGSTGGFASAPQQVADNLDLFGTNIPGTNTLGTNPMTPMFVQDVVSPMGGISGFGGGKFPDLFGSPDVGMSFADPDFGFSGSLFGSGGSALPVNILSANDSFFSGISDGLGGVANSVLGMLGGGGGGGGLGSIIGGIGSLLGGSTTGGGFGGILQMGLSLLGGLFAGGGVVGRGGGIPFSIGNYADGGLIAAIQRERSLNGGRQAIPAVLTAGERVLTIEQNKRFERLGGERILNMASGGVVGGQPGQFAAMSGGGSSVTVNSPVTINTSGEDGGVDAPRFKQILDAKVRQVIAQEQRVGGSLRSKR
jgi:hypothetical protein